jgi:uncharacterized protein (TIGR02594 family)
MKDPTWLAHARTLIGVAEIPGARHNATIVGWVKQLWAWLGLNDETPWCGTFVAHCLMAVGIQWAKKGFRALEWKSYGVPGHVGGAPGLGAIAVLQREGGGHVGFVTGRTADGLFVRILGGNQGNRVSEAWFETSRVVAYRTPTSLTIQAPIAPRGQLSNSES